MRRILTEIQGSEHLTDDVSRNCQNNCIPKAMPLDVDLNLSNLDFPEEVDTKFKNKYRHLICLHVYEVTFHAVHIQKSFQTWSETLDTSKEHSTSFAS